MAVVISKMKVESYEEWKRAWDASHAIRAGGGMRSATVLRDPSAPNALTILTRWANVEQANDFIAKQAARIKTHAAPGSTPEWAVHEEALTESYASSRTVKCPPCGKAITSQDDDELVRRVQEHAKQEHKLDLPRSAILGMATSA